MLTTLISLFLLQATARPAPVPVSALDPTGAPSSGPGESGVARFPKCRILYNLDGDSCMFLKQGSKAPEPITTADLKAVVHELTPPGSQVDTLLVCVNAQVVYYPTKVGTLRGMDCTPEERRSWPVSEQQRFRNVQAFLDAGVDPYAVLLAEARNRGLEALLTFRVNDAHGNDFLRTAFWHGHPEYRMGNGALDFRHDAVREYVFRLIEEAVQRYDCDGIELDFQRFPTFFKDGKTEERVAKISNLVARVRTMLDIKGAKRGRRLILAARVPSDYGRRAHRATGQREPWGATPRSGPGRDGWTFSRFPSSCSSATTCPSSRGRR